MNQTLAAPHVWADGKRHLWWLGIMPLATPLLSGALAITTGVQQLWWVGVLVIFGLIPLIDGLLGEDVSNPPESAVSHLESQRYYRWIVYTGVLFVIASVVITGWLAAGGIDWIINGGLLHATATLEPSNWLARTAAFITARTELHGAVSWLTYVGMAMSTGAATGIAINTAHELGHKPKPLKCSWPRSPWRRPSTATSTPNITVAITYGSPLRKTPPARASVKVSGHSCRVRCGSALCRPGTWSANACANSACRPCTGRTRCSAPGCIAWCCGAQ